MSTDVPLPDDSRRLKVTFDPAPGTIVVPSDDPRKISIRVPVVRVSVAQLNAEADKEKAEKAAKAAAAKATPAPITPTPSIAASPSTPQPVTFESLPDDPGLLKQMILEVLDLLGKKDHEVESLKHRLSLLARRLYGVKSEKFNPDQLLLFPDMNQPDDDTQASATTTPPAPTTDEQAQPKRKGHGRRGLPKNLRREPHLHELSEEQRQCPCCKVACVKFGEDVSEQLDYIPASLFVNVHTRCKYACPNCHDYVIVAGKPPQPIEKGLPGPGLLAQVIVSKYADHLPLHRLERIFARQGAELARSTMCGWMKSAADLLKPLYDTMVSDVLLSRVLHTDDTKVPWQDPKTPGKLKSARLWGYFGDHAHPQNVFDFTLDWSRDGPRDFLEDFRGFLQADGLSGYDTMGAATATDDAGLVSIVDRAVLRAGCWAHGRRHFFDAKDSDPARAAEAMARIRRLYAVENEAKAIILEDELTGDAADATRLRLRQEKAVPELSSLCQWLKGEQSKVLPKSPMGEAIRYALNQWPALARYADYGFLAIDNNVAERGLRPIALGRNNWLFVGSETGGHTAAVLFTMTSTCHRHRVDPLVYLRDALTRLAAGPLSPAELAALLPHRWTAPTNPAETPASPPAAPTPKAN